MSSTTHMTAVGVRFVDVASQARTYTTIGSPVGELTLVGAAEVVSGLYMTQYLSLSARGQDWREDADTLPEARRQLEEYFAGERTSFDLALSVKGTQFQKQVWQQLLEIPYGETISYGQLADAVGAPRAFRAAGSANGRNQISVIIPCHRVIATGGKLGGYGGGLANKQFLLDLERRHR